LAALATGNFGQHVRSDRYDMAGKRSSRDRRQ
jgi:hypothetical protein